MASIDLYNKTGSDPQKSASFSEDREASFRSEANNCYVPGIPPNEGQIEHDGLLMACPLNTTEAKLMRKIDLRVIPCLFILYFLAFLDRVNIANSKSFHLTQDLKLTGNQYNTALTIFFVPYVVFEIISNILMKRLSPNVWLPFLMFLFGLVNLCQGLVQNFGGLLAARFFLGLCEAGMLPGCFYLIGMWYKRSEAQRRYTLFLSSTTLAGAFAGLLASAIGKMDGLMGYSGWRWIFILEGVLTCVVALVFFFLIPSFPEDAKWLTAEELKFVQARLEVDQGRSVAERKITSKDVVHVLKDFKVILGGFMYFGVVIPVYSYAYFAPSIISSYGYSPVQTQVHSVPPWACAFVFSMLTAAFSDFTRHRFAFTIASLCVTIAGFSILLTVHDNTKLQYGALFLVVMGAYSAMPVIVCWFNMNLGGHHRRSIGTAWQVGFGNIGGIIATYSFLAADAPEYKKGYGICLGSLCLSAVSCLCYLLALLVDNRRRERMPTDLGLSAYEKTELGDLSPDYRYLL
ncbi:hypothetical protein DID88_010047 [Monilinia fructigena]|uniref:Major facilitator superfamily (MFS) profile domain-containing protein n=1 Tax=Monilinia fructigena TaxID=38457 RepID=A0A395IKZ5_9HELO|nr:hypothetical protein DID88_010047 [Monilinia fructigena]